VVVPVGYGDGIAGIARGFARLAERGTIERAPRLLAAVTSSSLPDALAGGWDQPRPVTVVAPSALSIACPQATFQALDAVRGSGGAARLVDERAALRARERLSREEGIYAELSSATAYAAVVQARRDGTIAAGESIVLVMTSPGLKDQLLPGDPQRELAPVAPTLDAVLTAIDETVARAPRDDHGA
jgi:threonine synthase